MILGGGSPVQAGIAQVLVLVGLVAAQTVTVTVGYHLTRSGRLVPEDLAHAVRDPGRGRRRGPDEMGHGTRGAGQGAVRGLGLLVSEPHPGASEVIPGVVRAACGRLSVHPRSRRPHVDRPGCHR